MRKIQPVEVREEVGPGRCETVYLHPSFGQVGVSRVSGLTYLYGSDFRHSSFIRLHVKTSELHRSLAHDHYYAKDHIVELDLSEAQWATLISSLNVGQGVPCTLTYVRGQGAIPLFEPESKQSLFRKELKESLEGLLVEVRSTMDTVEKLGLPKGKAAVIKSALDKVIRELVLNVPFVEKSFNQAMEETVEKAKTEVHGYVVRNLMSLGFDALQSEKEAPVLIEHKVEDDASKSEG